MPANPDEGLEAVELAFDYAVGLDIAQSFWHHSQEFDVPESPGKPVRASFKIAKGSLQTEFLGWVRSFGSKVEVVHPQWLKKLIGTR
jgi:hypothetical protein